MSELSEDDIQEIHKSAVENTMAEYSSVVKGVNINRLQEESKKALVSSEYSCSSCGSQGLLHNDDELLLTLERPVDEFDSKEEAVDASNLVPLCQECFEAAEGEAVSSAEQSKNIGERAQYSVKGFEKLVANNTPTIILRQLAQYIVTGFLLLLLGTSVYGLYNPSTTATGLVSSLINGAVSSIQTLFIEYTILVFILIVPLIALYTLFEHYQPKAYSSEQYVKSWQIGSVSIPYIFHPVLLVITSVITAVTGSNILTEVGAKIITVNDRNYTEPSILTEFGVTAATNEVAFGFSVIAMIFLLLSFPRVFRKLVRADKSEIMARSQLAETSEKIILDRYNDIVVTSHQTTKPRVTKSYIKEYYDSDIAVDNSGKYYSPLVWIFFSNVMISYILLFTVYASYTTVLSPVNAISQILLFAVYGKWEWIIDIPLTGIASLVIFTLPTVLVVSYLLYRRRKFNQLSSELSNLEEKIEAENSIE